MIPLQRRIRPYAWGSRTAIAALAGPSGARRAEPEAELWLGAHPYAPPSIAGGVPLTRAHRRRSGRRRSARRTVDRFGPRLPFLLKVLAAAEPLSLQAHPDACPGGATGTSTDPAQLRRPVPQARAAGGARRVRGAVRLPRPGGDGGRSWPRSACPALAPLVEAAAGGQGPAGRGRAAAGAGRRDRPLWRPSRRPIRSPPRSASKYPGDPGVVLALLLNHVRLRPGEAVFMPAGNLHAYLRRHRRRDHGGQRQRAARRAHARSGSTWPS